MPNLFRQHEHICSLYDTEDEQLTMAAEYLSDGLGRGERCYYVARSRHALTHFRGALARTGVDAAAMAKRGALIEATNAEAHLVGGHFDSERMIALLNEAVEAALNDGFDGLRTCGDMSWLLDEPSGWGLVVEYEAFLNEFFQGVRAAGMCQYDRRRLPAHLIDHALATHSSAFVEGHHKPNPFYWADAISTRRRTEPLELAWKIRELRRSRVRT